MNAPRFRASWTWLKGRVVAVPGWRRYALAAGLGVLAAAALPPLHVLVLLLPAFVGLIWMMEAAAGWRRAFAVGWWFGFGHFAAGFYWIAFAFMVQPEKFAWMIPVAIPGLAAGIALFPAAAVLLTALSGTRGIGRILVFGVAWTVMEWVRGWFLTGFPWNLIGTVWVVSDGMMQAAAVAGVYGLGLLTVVIAAMPAVLGDPSGGTGRARRVAVIVAFVVLAAVWGGGQWRLAGADDGMVEGVRLRLVQPNIAQKIKWRPELRLRHVLKQMRMGASPVSDDGRTPPPPTHVIWAETAVPFAVANDRERLAMIASATPRGGLTITGAPRIPPRDGGPFKVWNSLHAIDDKGRVVATYDKHHLVPFGEYVPLRHILRISRIVPGGTDFSAGPGPRTLHLEGLPPVSPLICYEAIFPGAVVDTEDRPQWLLNVTNDAWYGLSAGPYQHFAAARMRTVEEGLPLVRVANTGISAVVDAYGRLVSGLDLGATGVVDSGLPVSAGIPPYGRFGDWTIVLIWLLTAGTGWVVSRPR